MVSALVWSACGGGDPSDPTGPVTTVPDMPLYNAPMCLPVDDPSVSPQHTLDSAVTPPLTGFGYDLGHATDLVSFGPPTAWNVGDGPDQFREILVGAPGVSTGSFGPGQGRVRWVGINESTGEFEPSTAEPVEEFLSPFPCCSSAFGASVLAADWADGISVDEAGVYYMKDVGQEVLVGAPWEAAGDGRVVLYRSKILDSDIPMAGSRASWSWEIANIISPPGSASASAGFGTAMASASDDVGFKTPWVAISAPGAGEVYLFRGEPPSGSQPDQFTHFQTINLTTDLPGGLTPYDVSLGVALVADDFDRDGSIDLAIGAPSAAGQVDSRVFVIGGDGMGGLDTSDVLVMTDSLGSDTGLGKALAVGETHLFEVQGGGGTPVLETRRMLYMGAPDTDLGAGGLCWIAFDEDSTSSGLKPHAGFGSAVSPNPTCVPSPLPHFTTDFDTARWGASVLVGNLSPVDPYLSDVSDFALLDEVAVGAPEAKQFVWQPHGWFHFKGEKGAASGPSGLVTIYRGTRDGPFIESLPDLRTRPLTELFLNPDSSTRASRFGTSLLEIDVHRSGRPDLVVGAPGRNENRGAIQLLNSQPLNGIELTSTDAGQFDTLDSNNNPISAEIIPMGSRMAIRTDQEVHLTWRDDDGEICARGDDAFTGAFLLDQTFQHEIDGGATTLVFCIDNRIPSQAEVVSCASVDPSNGFDETGDAFEITLEIDDAQFGNTNPMDDTVTLNIQDARAWVDLGWLGYGWFRPPNRCTLTNNPFVFTRDTVMVETCE